MKKYIFLIMLPFFAISNTGFDKLKKFSNLNLEYSQDRYVKNVDISLKSSGSLAVKDKSKIIWSQKKPFENTFELIKNDQSDLAKKNPVIAQVSKILFQILDGDTKNLSETFEINSKSNESLDVVLTPKDTQMRKVISKIEVKGRDYVESFSLIEKSGNIINLKFFNIKSQLNEIK